MKKIVILIIGILFLSGCSSYQEYRKTIKVFNNEVSIILYEKSDKKANTALKEIKKIYETYELVQEELNNIKSSNKDSKISKELEDIINYYLEWNKKSNGYINVNLNDLMIKYDDYYDKGISFKIDDLDTNISNVKIKNHKLGPKANINLDYYILGFATREVYIYLQDKNISKFFINDGENVLAGFPNDKEYYNVGIASPFDDSVLKMLKVKNKMIVTKNVYNDYYELDGEKYSKLINGKTLKPSNQNVSVTVIADPEVADALATTLFFMPIDEGLEYIKQFNAEAIWCYLENEQEKIEYTENINSY